MTITVYGAGAIGEGNRAAQALAPATLRPDELSSIPVRQCKGARACAAFASG